MANNENTSVRRQPTSTAVRKAPAHAAKAPSAAARTSVPPRAKAPSSAPANAQVRGRHAAHAPVPRNTAASADLMYRQQAALRRKKAQKRLYMQYAALALIVVVVVLVIVLLAGSSGNDQPPIPAETPVPTVLPEATSVNMPDALENALNAEDTVFEAPNANGYAVDYSHLRPTADEGMTPVFRSIETQDKVVAITIDDLNQPTNLKNILSLLEEYDAKATLFTLGKNVGINKENIKRAYEMGVEIENHGYDHTFVYHLTDEGLVSQIGKTASNVSDALGINYNMNFMRPPGGNGRHDPRLHAALIQGGFKGVAHWSLSSTKGANYVKNNVKPGDIILFHTTDSDVKCLNSVVPWLYENGYRMITLNEMFGYPENETSPYDENYAQLSGALTQPYNYDGLTYSNGTRMYGVKLMQDRLIELGYLKSGTADGDFGDNTEKAVKNFQKKAGIKQTGKADPATREAMMAKDAPKYK